MGLGVRGAHDRHWRDRGVQVGVVVMATIKTQYRDVPYEEIGHALNYPERWDSRRGQAVTVSVSGGPVSLADRIGAHYCDGLYWLILSDGFDNGFLACGCSHTLEIGD